MRLRKYKKSKYIYTLIYNNDIIVKRNYNQEIQKANEFFSQIKDCGFDVVNFEIERKSLNPFSEKKAINSIYNAIKNLKIDIYNVNY